MVYFKNSGNIFAQSAWAVEYTDCTSADKQDSPSECPVAQSAGAVEYTECTSAGE